MAIAEVTGHRASINNGANSAALVYPGTPTQGNLLIAALAWRGNATITSIPSGWSLAINGGDAAGIDSAIYYKIAGASEPTAATFNFSGSVFKATGLFEFSGIDTTSPVDTSTNNFGSGTAGNTGALGTLSQSEELVIALFSNISGDSTWSAHDNGLTELVEIISSNASTASNAVMSVASKVTSSNAGVTYGATLSTSRTWSAAAVAFKAAPSGTTVTGIPATLRLTAQPGTVVIGNTISGTAASLTISGQSGVVSIGNVINGQPASVTLQGVVGSITIGNIIDGTEANLIIQPVTGEISIGNAIDGIAAEIILNPVQGTVLIGTTIDGSIAEMELTGVTGSIHTSQSISGIPAQIQLTGIKGKVIAGTVSVSSFTITAKDAHFSIEAKEVNFSITATDSTLTLRGTE